MVTLDMLVVVLLICDITDRDRIKQSLAGFFLKDKDVKGMDARSVLN